MKTKIINIIGGPGAGKTTTAALVFAHLKINGYVVEYASEYAKQLIWHERFELLNDQYRVTHEQYDLLKKMNNKVQYVVTDGSLLHGLYYNRHNPDNVSNVIKTEKYILDCYNEFNNINIFLERGNFKYEKAGRQQTENEAKLIDKVLENILNDYGIKYVKMSHSNIKKIIEYIINDNE